jgi:glycosyltransferase involved in cell wall biosynthesis
MKTYVRELVARLPRVAPEFAYATFSRGANFDWSEQVSLPRAIREANLDAVHFLSQYVPLLLPRRFVVTIHDLIHLRFPKYFKATVGPYYATVVRYACSRAARVITDDPRTVEDLEKFLGVRRTKVRVIPLGVSERYFAPTQPYRAERPYVLYVGNHRRHKDLPTLFEAWSKIPASLPLDLYVTGPDDFGGELQRRTVALRGIVALGDVSTEQLIAYYAGARALVQPAWREGFGLPMLEAMAAGCPVIASSEAVPAPLKRAALTFAAGNVAELRAKLEALSNDEGLRERTINLGREAARELTWDRCARATADVYREVLEKA